MVKDEYSLYTSHANGFSINYPSNWTVQEDTGFFLVGFFPKTKGPVPTNIHIIIPDLSMFPEIPSPSEFIEISKSQIEQQGAKNIKVQETKYGEFKGHAFTYVIPSNEGEIRFKQFLFLIGSTVYVISYSSPSDKFDKYIHNYEEVVGTLKIFKAKGYKFTQLQAKTYQLSAEGKEVFYQIWHPKSWKSVVNNQNQQRYRDDEYDVHYHVNVDPTTAETLEQFNNTVARERLAKITSKSDYEIKSAKLTNHGQEITCSQVQVENEDLVAHRFNIWWFIYKGYAFTLTFKTPAADGQIYDNIHQRLLARIRVQDYALESPHYDIFDNFSSRYCFSIPKTFSLIPKLGGVPSLIFEDSQFPGLPLFVITCEELGKPALLNEYQDLIISFHMKGLEGNSQLMSTTESHIDKYRATQCVMRGTDPELQTPCKLLFKCAVIRRSKGFLLNLRVPIQYFDDYYNKTFFIFDSVSFY
ncbi:hypothetical protein DLAC_01257 [Tieghemostelium lacteum]|uniref:Uncharacterized protein n=1 Tax=Tieghemostelium lacteum TaxID=361077 RepID=A0A152A8N2_TIELA|nr:hypothetical protein DLAC_01257 [Tieghemostelium lacteum]|eukprot:KYR02417.1 hypothetical protein DLAC_01257 [Tieghemostelium lacteum]